MKNLGKIFVLAFLQVGVILGLPLFVADKTEDVPELPTAAVMAEISETEEPQKEDEIIICLLADGEKREVNLEEYLLGVVAAEMPMIVPVAVGSR